MVSASVEEELEKDHVFARVLEMVLAELRELVKGHVLRQGMVRVVVVQDLGKALVLCLCRSHPLHDLSQSTPDPDEVSCGVLTKRGH